MFKFSRIQKTSNFAAPAVADTRTNQTFTIVTILTFANLFSFSLLIAKIAKNLFAGKMRCHVLGCKEKNESALNRSEYGFFNFPKTDIQEIWIQRTGREKGSFNPAHYRICSKHFLPTDCAYNGVRWTKVKHAVPKLHLPVNISLSDDEDYSRWENEQQHAAAAVITKVEPMETAASYSAEELQLYPETIIEAADLPNYLRLNDEQLDEIEEEEEDDDDDDDDEYFPSKNDATATSKMYHCRLCFNETNSKSVSIMEKFHTCFSVTEFTVLQAIKDLVNLTVTLSRGIIGCRLYLNFFDLFFYSCYRTSCFQIMFVPCATACWFKCINFDRTAKKLKPSFSNCWESNRRQQDRLLRIQIFSPKKSPRRIKNQAPIRL